MKSIKFLTPLGSIIISCVLMTACNPTPSVNDGEKVLGQKIDSESQGQVKLVSFKKTDGQMSVVNAVKLYELDYEAEIEFQSDGTWFKGMDGEGIGFGFSAQQVNQGSWAAFANQVSGGTKVHLGDHVKIAGVIQGEKKESGWVLDLGDSHVISGLISVTVLETQKKAESGDASAEAALGNMYCTGRGVETNYIEAVKWFKKAAEQGDARGQNDLGVMLRNGWGIQKDETEGLKWTRKAAEAGEMHASYNLGYMYLNGIGGVDTNYVEAAKWFQKSVDQGSTNFAMFQLGRMYWSGIGVATNHDAALNYYRKAAQSGNKDAQEELSKIQNN